MAFIYKIKNNINNKCYVGKTEESIEKRFSQHISESKRERCKNRPLYRAFNKYGYENFSVELIEETDNPEEKEIYWIDFLDTYNKGYNATKGGDGKKLINEELILHLLQENDLNCNEVSRILNHDVATIKKVALKHNIYEPTGILKGEEHGRSVLKESDVIEILKLYVPKKFGKRKISKLLNLPLHAVDGVITGKSWKHIKEGGAEAAK